MLGRLGAAPEMQVYITAKGLAHHKPFGGLVLTGAVGHPINPGNIDSLTGDG